MKDVIHNTLQEKLGSFKYDVYLLNINSNRLFGDLYVCFYHKGEKCSEIIKSTSDLIRNRLRQLGYARYKFVVQVVLGERREQGVRVGSRCLWDAGTDNQASVTFFNDSLFCVATAFAVYFY